MTDYFETGYFYYYFLRLVLFMLCFRGDKKSLSMSQIMTDGLPMVDKLFSSDYTTSQWRDCCAVAGRERVRYREQEISYDKVHAALKIMHFGYESLTCSLMSNA